MSFLDAIKLGVEASNNYDRNMSEIKSIFGDANGAILEKTGADLALFSMKDKICTSCYFDFVRFGSSAYPVEIQLHGNRYMCHDGVALTDTLCELMSQASFGFYVKKIMRK